MLNTVLLFTPPNQIASSTTCGHFRPIVSNTVSTKSMLAHLLSTINHWFQIIRVFGHLHFRCYSTWSMAYTKFLILIWSRILRSTQKTKLALKKDVHLAFFWKENFDRRKQRHQVVAPKNISCKIFKVKNYTMSEVFRLLGPFYRVADFCSGGLTFGVSEHLLLLKNI